YIPLDQELKVKGKAAVDVIGGRGGKSLGSYIQMGLLTVFSGSALYQLVPVIAPIVLVIVVLWILSVLGLSKRFTSLTAQREEEKQQAIAEKAAEEKAPAADKTPAQV